MRTQAAALLRDRDRYELLGELASGGMATVYLARMRRPMGFSRLVAVKCMHPQFAKDPSFATMFLDEARLTARLRHPNIVPTLDILAEDGQLHIVMEYVEGESLAGLLRAARNAETRLPLPIGCAIVHDALLGLHEAHEATDDDGVPLAIVHRDVSPQNVIVGIDGLARVLDFGVAKARSTVGHTSDNEIKGKIPYMPPEQLYGEELDRRVDVYAAGVLLWEALVGARLFDGSNESVLVRRITEEVPPPPSSRVSGVSPALDALVLRALARQPADRFESAHAMAEELAKTVALPRRTEVSAWVKRFARSRDSLAAVERAAPREGEATTTVAVVERAAESVPAIEEATTPPPLRGKGRALRRLAAGASAAALAVAVAGIAVAKVAGTETARPRIATAQTTTKATLASAAEAPVVHAVQNEEKVTPPARVTPIAPIAPIAKAKPRIVAAAPTPATPRVVERGPEPASSNTEAKNPSCRPPYVVDALGQRHYKVECL